MKAFLLAAGRGTRISRRIAEVPKCTLPIDGQPLIRRTAEMLLERGIQPIVCVGYRRDKVYEALEALPVSYYHNPFYDVTNSIASLWFARRALDESALVMNGDVFVSQELLDSLLSDEREVVMVSDASRTEQGDYFFSLDDSGCVVKYGKDLPLEERTAEYVGLAKIDSSFIPEFRNRLEEFINDQKHSNWWEDVLYSFAADDGHQVATMDVSGEFWSEVDFFDDYERILQHVNQKSDGHTRVASDSVR